MCPVVFDLLDLCKPSGPFGGTQISLARIPNVETGVDEIHADGCEPPWRLIGPCLVLLWPSVAGQTAAPLPSAIQVATHRTARIDIFTAETRKVKAHWLPWLCLPASP
jgi:hypothetical protein